MSSKKIAMAVGTGFEDLEFWAVNMRLQEEGYDLYICGDKAGATYTAKSGGLKATAECSFEDLNADELDALLIPGGWAPDSLRRNPYLLELVRAMDKAEKLLGFICHAGWVASSAGIMKGRSFTGTVAVKDDLTYAGGKWVDLAAFREKNIIWGRVVADIPDYNRELVKALKGA